jgi:curved DNA-binding protein CbpA
MVLGGTKQERWIYYQVLGISRNASTKDIRSAYLRMAKQHHPDAGGDPQNFLQVRAAYQVLSDPTRRQLYDSSSGAEDFDRQEQASDAQMQAHVDRETLWQQRMKERAERERKGERPNPQDVPFNFDEWERGHRLGKYGDGPEGRTINETMYAYYTQKAREEEDARRAANGEKGDTLFFRRRAREREDAERAQAAAAAAAAAKDGSKGGSRSFHTLARASFLTSIPGRSLRCGYRFTHPASGVRSNSLLKALCKFL